jgi:hypothetical protein
MTRFALIALLAAPVFAARQVPAGAELSLRLNDRVASDVTSAQAFTASVIAPLVIDGTVRLPAGLTVAGSVKQAKAYSAEGPAKLELTFKSLSDGKVTIPLHAVTSALENARETLDDKGVITGIDAAQSYGGRLNEGLSKLGANEKLAGLAGILQQAKQALKIGDVNGNVDYAPGVEFRIRLTEPLTWTGVTEGPESKLTPFPNEAALPRLVTSQPYRTAAERPQRPSDITNLMFIGTEEQVREAFTKAGWSEPAVLNAESKLETARAMIENRGYKEGPMSILLLDGEPPQMAWQKGNNTFASRHHLRIYRRPDTFDGKPVWVCSSTQDTGIEFSDRDRTFIHKVDSEIDRERAKVVTDLLFTGLVKSVAIVARPEVPTTLENATGDTLKTDGSMAVVLF